jgi:hypothetical protein
LPSFETPHAKSRVRDFAIYADLANMRDQMAPQDEDGLTCVCLTDTTHPEGSTLLIWMEDVVLRLDGDMARVSAI